MPVVLNSLSLSGRTRGMRCVQLQDLGSGPCMVFVVLTAELCEVGQQSRRLSPWRAPAALANGDCEDPSVCQLSHFVPLPD